MPTTKTNPEASPLITAERLAENPQSALAVRPPWLHHIEFVTPEPEPEAHPAVQPVVILWAGRSRIIHEAHTPLAAAIMFEITRLPGVSIATNHNGSKSYYLRFTIEDVGEDLTQVSRFLINAAPHEQVMKTAGRKFDMRSETLAKRAVWKPSRDSRAILMDHIERIAKDWEASGRMPAPLTAYAYLENLKRLLQLIDLETTGRELSDMLPMTREEG